jgi:hypothetical protein
MTGQTGKRGADDLNVEGPVQRRGSVYALMQKQMLLSGGTADAVSKISAACGPQVGRRVSMPALSKGEAARGKDVDLFGLKKKTVSSSSDEDDDDDDDDDDDEDDDDEDDDDDDGPDKLWRYASFALQGEPIAAAASEHVTLPTPEDHGEFVTLALPNCTKPVAEKTVNAALEQMMRMQVRFVDDKSADLGASCLRHS